MYTDSKLADLQKAALAHTAKAREIIEANAGKDPRIWSPADRAAYDEAMAKGREKLDQIKVAKGDLAVLGAAKSLANEIGMPAGGGAFGGKRKHLAFTGEHVKRLGSKLASALAAPQGSKALASGVQTVGTTMLDGIVEKGRPAQSLLDVLFARRVDPVYTFLRQSVRTNNATVVAAGATKPTSVYSVVSVPNRLRVVAHMSEAMDKYMLVDAPDLDRFIEDELRFGLQAALEAEIISGDGTGEHMTGILNTSGLVTQAFATDILTSLRKGLTTLDTAGYQPGSIVLSAGDWESVDLLAVTAGATDVRGLPVDSAARRLWGVPVVLNQGLGTKTGLILGEDAVTLDHDGIVEAEWTDNMNDDFSKNQRRLRVEGRFSISVNQPGAVVKVATAA